MFLIVGLGNPGKKFQNTRHNIGFCVVDEFRKKNDFPVFKLNKKSLAETSEGKVGLEKVIIAKPQTFMNNSGQSVKKMASSMRLQTANLFVVHDDIDLPLGKLRISVGRSSAGHKGVESIIRELKTKNFARFRIGIMNHESRIKNTERFVLKKFNKNEEKILKEAVEKTVEAIETAIKEGLEKAMMKFN